MKRNLVIFFISHKNGKEIQISLLSMVYSQGNCGKYYNIHKKIRDDIENNSNFSVYDFIVFFILIKLSYKDSHAQNSKRKK